MPVPLIHFQQEMFSIFGLKSSPIVFTKILVVLVALLRIMGVSLFPYLDVILIKAPSYQQSLEAVSQTVTTLQKHGFMINMAKCSLQIRRAKSSRLHTKAYQIKKCLGILLDRNASRLNFQSL